MITRFSPVSSYKLPQEDSFPFLDGLPSARTTIPSACSCERLSRSALVWVCVRGAYGVGHTLESGRRNLEKYFFKKSLP